MNPSLLVRAVWLLSALLLASAARADHADISFKHRGDNEKNFVRDVGTAIVKAAHKTAKKIELDDYKYTDPKPGRKELHLTMEYHGYATNKRYKADIVLKIDATNNDSWEVLDIDYTDNNTAVRYNANNVQELKRQFNK